jgi:hypothetical protein
MTQHSLPIDGVEVPAFFYGTAWQEERTQHLTELAIHAYRGEFLTFRIVSPALRRSVPGRGSGHARFCRERSTMFLIRIGTGSRAVGRR